jgi:hypothetical protein
VTWTVQDIEEVTEKVLAEVGFDHKYAGPNNEFCLYQSCGKPQCLVGHILAALGVDMNVLATYEGRNIVWTVAELQLDIEHEAVCFLDDMQVGQDFNAAWGDALATARRMKGTDERVWHKKNPLAGTFV